MAFGTMETGGDESPIAEINMVPFIDVVLVLLIIFMVTAPLLTHSVRLELPRASSAPTVVRETPLRIDIDADHRILWNGEPVQIDALDARFAAAAIREPRPELLIRADRTTSYEVLARVMSDAARHGLGRIGFLTDPRDP
ncbi:MAG: biopolymer transporter ExbD [Burkholderiaceae bacterium]|nr:biopolymer transporter ExbD [Burkholderiaceae bacterium]